MKNSLHILWLLILTVSFTESYGQSSIEELTGKFFKLYASSPQTAVDYLFATNSWMQERNKDGIDNVKNKLSGVTELIGKYYGYEKITEKQIGQSYKMTTYLIKYDRQPLRFTFIFYKPNDTWQLQNFQFDDKLDDELEESGKVYRLK